MRDLAHVREIDSALRGQPTADLRDALVIDSWRRCVETYGMDPARAEAAHIVTEAELRRHREQSERLIATARSGLRSLFRQVAGQNYVLLLADAEGVCVDFFGDPRFEDELREAGLYLGSDWSEDLAGTCGVGSCLVTGEAVTIHQSDHFGLAHTPLSCTAAPIYDTQGQLTAVLDISLLRSPSPKSSQNLAMNLVRASARRVEMANLMATTRRDWVLRLSSSPEFLEVDPEAAVALDGSGRIVGLTHAAQTLLAPEDGGPLIGTPVGRHIDLSVDDLPDLMRGRPTEDRVIRLRDGRGLFGHAIAPQKPRVPGRGGPAQLPGGLSSLCGAEPVLEPLLHRAARLAATPVPLLIEGETGTGKETLARAIHVCGPPERAFHRLHCASATPGTLQAFAEARAGTLFLKGVEDLGPEAQGALLALLESRADLRPVASVRTDLARAAQEGTFRPELFFRLAGDRLRLPPLRLRHDLAWLIDRALRRSGVPDMGLSPAARAELQGREWPGNIRELESVLRVAAAVAEGRVIDLPDLPAPCFAARRESAPDEGLEAILDACGWNMAQAARRLGVNRSTVMRRVRKAGLTPPQ
ncbi:sigma-54-dependent Fis family transcriptional regulator [Salipiger mucosus]|uniref:Transcriptional activator of acetoin dehydrogenase operon AcoR n=1 Tax=Salipiger mucosus DSM 16094 TaxID=1123237 RepID=S9Q5G6_9RHOB|nr:sigma-54-dependent Fis family transcriptional regulator [Salipiger mucosus]EPX76581.1 Transcriptional activator of acetoin dehydrogenase operon AcoR [Salipiger mucosus DSM 16094]